MYNLEHIDKHVDGFLVCGDYTRGHRTNTMYKCRMLSWPLLAVPGLRGIRTSMSKNIFVLFHAKSFIYVPVTLPAVDRNGKNGNMLPDMLLWDGRKSIWKQKKKKRKLM